MVCNCGATVKAAAVQPGQPVLGLRQSLFKRSGDRFASRNASNQQSRALFRFDRNGKGSRPRHEAAARKSALGMREPAPEFTPPRLLWIKTAGLSMCARSGTGSRPVTNDARLYAETTSAVRTRLTAETENGPGPFHAPSASAQPSIQPASRDQGTIEARTRFPAGTRGGRTPDARDEQWPIRSRHRNEHRPSNPAEPSHMEAPGDFSPSRGQRRNELNQ